MNISRLFSFSEKTLAFSAIGVWGFNSSLNSPEIGSRHCRVVGLDGLEPSTSRLSGVRSNHLSYKPLFHSFGIGSDIIGDDGVLNQNLHSVQIRKTLFCFHGFSLPCFSISKIQGASRLRFWKWWRWWGSNPWPPACRAGALPAELHPRFRVAFAFSKTSKLSLVWSLKIEQQKVHTHILSETSLVIRRLRQLREKLSWSP